MNFVKQKGLFCHYGNLHSKEQKNLKLLVYVGTKPIKIYLRLHMDLVSIANYRCWKSDVSLFTGTQASAKTISYLFLDNFYEQDNETPGVVCVFSLKNPAYPEYLCLAQCGVLCLDIHPQHPHMLAAGLTNGNVAVYNLQKKMEGSPSYISTARNGKHQDAVWQVSIL